MARKGKRDPACVEAILRAVARGIRESAGFFSDAGFVGVDALSPDLAGTPLLDKTDGARDMLAKGVKVDLILRALYNMSVDPYPILFTALTSGDFITAPRIEGRVHSVEPRHAADGSIEGVDIVTDSKIIPGNDPVFLILPLPRQAGSAQAVAAKTPKPAKPKQQKLPIRHQMIIDILRRLYPDARSAKDVLRSLGFKDLEYQVGNEWSQECKRRGVDYKAPRWDTIKRALVHFR